MKRNEKNREQKIKQGRSRHQHPLAGDISSDQRRRNSLAHQQADEDMKEDADFTSQHKNDDLDEGESARLGEDRTDLV
jgi:hypothetical protein